MPCKNLPETRNLISWVLSDRSRQIYKSPCRSHSLGLCCLKATSSWWCFQTDVSFLYWQEYLVFQFATTSVQIKLDDSVIEHVANGQHFSLSVSLSRYKWNTKAQNRRTIFYSLNLDDYNTEISRIRPKSLVEVHMLMITLHHSLKPRPKEMIIGLKFLYCVSSDKKRCTSPLNPDRKRRLLVSISVLC